MGNSQCGTSDRKDELLDFINNKSIHNEENKICDRMIFEYKMLKNIILGKGKRNLTKHKINEMNSRASISYIQIDDYNIFSRNISYFKKRLERLNKWIKMIKLEYTNSENIINMSLSRLHSNQRLTQKYNSEAMSSNNKILSKDLIPAFESGMSTPKSSYNYTIKKSRETMHSQSSGNYANFTTTLNNNNKLSTINMNNKGTIMKIEDDILRNESSGYDTPRSFLSAYTPNDSFSNVLSYNPENFFNNKSHTDKIIEESLKYYCSKKEKHFKERVSKAPPVSLRWTSWIVCSRIPTIRDESFYYYCMNKTLDENMDSIIKKDLNRTFPKKENIEQATYEECLYRILRAFASNDEEISYCQGMNLVAGFLLIISDFNEVDTFYMLLSLFSDTFINDNENSLRGFFCEEFPLLKVYTDIFNIIFKRKLPNLHKHLEKLNLPNEVWIAPWLQTLFTICLPVDFCARLWDCMMATGKEFIFSFSIALISELEKDLLKLEESSDVLEYYKSWLRHPLQMNSTLSAKINIEDVIKNAHKMDITKSMINKLQQETEKRNGIYISTLNKTLKKKYDMTVYNKRTTLCDREKELMIDDFHNYSKNKFVLDTESSNSYLSEDKNNANNLQYNINEKEYYSGNKEVMNKMDKEFDKFSNNNDVKSNKSGLIQNEGLININFNSHHNFASNYQSKEEDIIFENSFDDFDEDIPDEKMGVTNDVNYHVLNVSMIKTNMDDEEESEFHHLRNCNRRSSNDRVDRPLPDPHPY